MNPRSSNALRSLSILATAAALLAACSSGGGGSSTPSFAAFTTGPYSGAFGPPVIVVSGANLAYLADESTTGPTGTDLNADGDGGTLNDKVAIAVNSSSGVRTVLRASKSIAWIGDHLYMVVDEAEDGMDWNGVLGDQMVLLHWKSGTPAVPDFVDTLPATVPAGTVSMLSLGTLLFYSAGTTTAGPTMTNLMVLSPAFPTTSTMVLSDDLVAELSPRILRADEGLVFLALDENVEGRPLNPDADNGDTILALLDGTGVLTAGSYDRDVLSTHLALPSTVSPTRARKFTTHDWQVGFLVSETAQGATNFNVVNAAAPVELTAGWQPSQCVSFEDADSNDDVLFFLEFNKWVLNPGTDGPRNTGLVAKGGADGHGKIAIQSNFIAVISPEASEGTCDLNQDGDLFPDDDVVRMTAIVTRPTPVVPIKDSSLILALFDVPGGTHGLAELSSRFVVEVSESSQNHDYNGGGKTDNLIAWILPAAAPAPWDFKHGSSNLTFVGASWMAEQKDRALLDVAYKESVRSPGPDGVLGTGACPVDPDACDDLGGVSINTLPASMPGDFDALDSVPTFAQFAGSPTALKFPGVAIAVKSDNAGIQVERGVLFYRVSESEDNRSWNGDTDVADFVLRQTSTSSSVSSTIATSSAINGQPSVVVDQNATPTLGAFLTDETKVGLAPGTDVNGDGAKTFIVQYFRF